MLLLLTATDVLHSVAVPPLLLRSDAVPGRISLLVVLSDRTGIFAGQCSELCGSLHGFMSQDFAVKITNGYSSINKNITATYKDK